MFESVISNQLEKFIYTPFFSRDNLFEQMTIFLLQMNIFYSKFLDLNSKIGGLNYVCKICSHRFEYLLQKLKYEL